MTGSDRSFRTLLAQAADWARERAWNARASSEHEEEEPLRAALFSSDQMVAHGKLLAGRHRLAQTHRADRLLARLASNQRTLENVARQLREAVAKERPVTPASEWLLDNMYLIDEEIRTARRHLPHGYSRELPRLADPSPLTDGTQPRVYDLALESVAHADGRLSRGTLSRFVAAYQSVQPLKLGELWAFPIMLRLALIENLRRVAVRVAVALDERDLAETWASRMLQAAEERPSDLILVIADMARSNPAMSSAFVAEFARRLQGQGAALALPLTWMEQRLSDANETIEHLVHLESQKQAASQVSVSNSIGSLRLLGATHWPEFVETLSSVEQILREDPIGVYGRMDFGTRDTYRHAVESLARAGAGDEPAVAHKAIELATEARRRLQSATNDDTDDREAHVGYWLIANGRPTLESAMNARRTGFLHRAGHSPLPAYVGGILAFAMLMSLGPMQQAAHELDLQLWSPKGIGLVLLLMLATSQLALSLVNWIVTLSVTPEALPRMDYTSGIAPRSRTLVAVPTLLGKHADVDMLVDALEVRFLANRDPHLQFALLTDLRDARQETLPEDADLLDYAEAAHRGAEQALRRARRRQPAAPAPVPAAAPAAPLERHRERVDGPRAQARQAGRPERAAARSPRCREGVRAHRRRHADAAGRALRHHARLRHPAAARIGLRDGVGHGAPAQSPALRHRREEGRGRRGLRHPAAARGPEPAQRQPLGLRPPVRRRAGDRSVHACHIGRLPGPVRRRLVRRQGHLRRRRVRTRDQREHAGEPHPQP